jgi:hypothetical protein
LYHKLRAVYRSLSWRKNLREEGHLAGRFRMPAETHPVLLPHSTLVMLSQIA